MRVPSGLTIGPGVDEDVKRLWLVRKAGEWAYIARLASDPSLRAPEDALAGIKMHMFGAHMTVLAMRHLKRCLAVLSREVGDTAERR